MNNSKKELDYTIESTIYIILYIAIRTISIYLYYGQLSRVLIS